MYLCHRLALVYLNNGLSFDLTMSLLSFLIDRMNTVRDVYSGDYHKNMKVRGLGVNLRLMKENLP